MKKTTLHTTILVSVAALLAGCAVLTVDVDVYKGPLANHEDIQMEQMAAMAIGAKPLLVRLRDTLEVEHEYWKEKEHEYLKSKKKNYFWNRNLETRLSYLRESPWYSPEYIGPYWSENNKTSRFRNSVADNVNNILYMYEDRGPHEYVKLSDTFFRILTRYKESYAILRPPDMREDKALARKVKEEVTRDPNAWRLPFVGDIPSKKASRASVAGTTKSDLWEAYENFLSRERRDALGVLEATFEYLDSTSPATRSALAGIKRMYPQDGRERQALQNVTSAAQGLLAETALVDVCADEIFGMKGKLREQFVTRVKEIAKAYLDSRAALEDLWLTMMDGLMNISRMPVADDEEDVCRAKLTAGIIDLSLDIIQPRYLAVLLDVAEEKEKKESISDDIYRLACSLKTYPTADPNVPHGRWNYSKMKYLLGRRLNERPIETAEALRAIHEFSKSALDLKKASIAQHVDKGVLRNLAYKEGWKFGLIRAPYEGGAEELELKKLEMDAHETFVYGGGAFAGGRLDRGLETLIEDYLNLTDKTTGGEVHKSELKAARQTLSDALVRFAKKLLFVANNRSLISPPRDPGLITGTLDILSRGLIGEKWTGKATDLIGLSEAGTNQYTRILQAVGNSILVQADALHQQEVHENKLKNDLESEIYAVNYTLNQSPSRVIDRLLEALRASLSAKAIELQEAHDRMSAARKERDRAKQNLEEARKLISDIKIEAGETFEEVARRQEKTAISAYHLLVSKESVNQTVQDAQVWAIKAKNAALSSEPEPKTPKDCAAALATKLTAQANQAKMNKIKDLLDNASSYFSAEPNGFSSEDCTDANEAYEKLFSAVNDDYSRIRQLLRHAREADEAQESVENQEKIVTDANNAVVGANGERIRIKDAIDAINDAKYTVFRKADESGPNPSPRFVRELLRMNLEESLPDEKEDPNGYTKYKNAIDILSKQPPPMEPVVFDDSKLPPESTAKEVRDLWITLLEYEHDLAKRNGDEDRADEIMEAIKAARRKREDMIFIRPAMAYLRTSFPATSLQSNPNLTWDNMLGGHMMRSIPFAPQMGEFLNPDAKRDARITAEIDKQFWQNINRVRVAGGGFTNYAVVKDDIGNWYVKGYSADPKDVIQSAKNLAMFAAGGKMGTPSLGPSALAEESNQARVTPGSTLESMLTKYEEDYREKTRQGYKLLCEIMNKSDANISDQIKELWNANEDVNDKQTDLETALKWSYTHFLEPFASTVEQNDEKDIAKQRDRIIEGIKRLIQFRNDLIWKITNVYSREGNLQGSDTPEQAAAKDIVRNVVDGQLNALLENRKDAITTYQSALTILAEATEQKE